MSIRMVCCVVLAVLIFSANAFALADVDFYSFKYLDGDKTKKWNQKIIFDDPAALANGSTFTLEKFSWAFLLGGFKKNTDVAFTAYFDGVGVNFAGHTNGKGSLMAMTSVMDAVTLGSLAGVLSDGRVKITFDEKHKVFASGGFGSGHVAPEPATMLLIGAGLAGLPIARRLKKNNRDS